MAPFRVHTVRFYDPEPKAIHAMALSSDNKMLALSRSDSSMELWDVQHLPAFKKYIPPLTDVQIECVCWYGDRLFTAGLHGFLYEMDYHQLDVKERHAVTSGSAWCMAVCKPTRQIAVGTEEGFVNIYNILNDSLEFHRLLDKQEGRIMCISWHPLGTYLATGSTDTIRIWNPETGHPISRMSTGRLERKKETIVWTIAMTHDSTVISGDSNGRTSFWSGETGAHVFTVQSHTADVLTIALNTKGNIAYSSGVDPTVMHFQEIKKPDGQRKWVKSLHRTISNHDVRCLAPKQDDYFSGGVDSYLTLSNYTTKSISRLPAIPRDGVLELAGDTGLCLVKYRSHVELWRLGESSSMTGPMGANLPLSQEPTRILKLETPNGERLVCSTIHKSGNFVAYSTKKRFRVFELKWSKKDPSKPCKVQRLKLLNPLDQQPHCIRFFQVDGKEFLLCGFGSPRLECFTVDKLGIQSSWTLETSEHLLLNSSIQHIIISGSTAVVSDFKNQVVAVDLKTQTVISKLPILSSACITAITISLDGKNCVLAYSDQKLAQIDIETARFTSFCTAFNQSPREEWKQRQLPVAGLNYIKEDLLLMYDNQNLIIVDEEKEMMEPEEKIHISEANHDDSQDGSMICSSPTLSHYKPSIMQEKVRIHAYPNLVAALPLSNNSIVCVELSSEQIESKLPPSLKVKKFGAQ